jgi:hypothetical protein
MKLLMFEIDLAYYASLVKGQVYSSLLVINDWAEITQTPKI